MAVLDTLIKKMTLNDQEDEYYDDDYDMEDEYVEDKPKKKPFARVEEPEDDFISWGSIRHICFEIIKGKNAPLKFKITLKLPNSYIEKMLTSVDTNIEASQVLGMYIHINYENNKLNVITGTSLSIFTMDKSIDKFWDKQITTLLNQHFELEIE